MITGNERVSSRSLLQIMKASLFIGEQRCRYLCTHSLINFWEFGFTSLRKNLLALLKIGRCFLLLNALQAGTFLTLSGILSASNAAECLHVGRTLPNQAGLPVCPAWDALRYSKYCVVERVYPDSAN